MFLALPKKKTGSLQEELLLLLRNCGYVSLLTVLSSKPVSISKSLFLNVLNSINTPKLLGSRHFKLQTISLPMISKDKP